MRVRHTVTFLTDDLSLRRADSLRKQLQLLRLIREEAALLNFVIYEDDASWSTVANLLDEHRSIDLAWTEYSAAEQTAAAWLDLRATSHHGYPMPSEDFGYLATTFGEGNYCGECGKRSTQRAPFRFRAEPRWGRRGVLQLNWVFDEFFVERAVYATIFAPLGVKAREVLHHRTQKSLETVVQLVSDSDSVQLELGDLESSACNACQGRRYPPLGRVQPQLRRPTLGGKHLVRSAEHFGGGGLSSNRLVMISGALYAELRKHDVRGVSFGVVPVLDAA
jgi:hypothetical protein